MGVRGGNYEDITMRVTTLAAEFILRGYRVFPRQENLNWIWQQHQEEWGAGGYNESFFKSASKTDDTKMFFFLHELIESHNVVFVKMQTKGSKQSEHERSHRRFSDIPVQIFHG